MFRGKQEAFLQRIDVTNLSRKGTLNVSREGTGEAIYRFWPTPHPDARELRAARVTGDTGPLELWIRIKNRNAEVIVSKLTYIPSPRANAAADADIGAVKSLPLPEILSRAMKRKEFEQVQSMNGYLVPLAGEGWVWYLNDPVEPPTPRIRARDGRTWPYDR
jgi:hypothetical protein